MAQIKLYGHTRFIAANRAAISDAVHACAVEALGLPEEKRFHRFFGLERDDFLHPPDRSDRYLIVEVSLFEGRSVETKKAFLRLLFLRLKERVGIEPNDLQVTLTETPRHNWGIRGLPADELVLNYVVQK